MIKLGRSSSIVSSSSISSSLSCSGLGGLRRRMHNNNNPTSHFFSTATTGTKETSNSSNHDNATAGRKSERTTHFGFRTIAEEEKENEVRKVFSRVAGNYDRMNDAMSLGIHRQWKNTFAEMATEAAVADTLNPSPMAFLDVAGGTGDIAFRLAKNLGSTHANDSTIRVIDINPEMLEVGRQRARGMGFLVDEEDSRSSSDGGKRRITFDVGNAEDLHDVPSNSIDVYTIAFGIRNCTSPQQVLNEAWRVLKPGGRLLVLEFSKVSHPVVRRLYDFHSFTLIPRLGALLSNDAPSYTYLVESIRNFPPAPEFEGMIRKAGFKTFGWRELSFGVCCVHGGFKL